MKVITTSGKEFEIEFGGQSQHQQLRSLFQHMTDSGNIISKPWAEDREEIISSYQKELFPNLNRETLTMVVDHYHAFFKAKFEAGEIDAIDQAIYFSQTILDELEKWAD
jgi:hypothetical protein